MGGTIYMIARDSNRLITAQGAVSRNQGLNQIRVVVTLRSELPSADH